MKVDVIIPVYNVERFLEECIDSILCQSYKNLEIILCDDGSTDSSPRICDEYAEKDFRIHVIHKQNGGLSDARNAGIDIASGKYIIFVDSDDFIDKNMITYLYNALITYQADMACCQRQEVKENGELIRARKRYKTFIINGNDKCMKEFLSNPQMDTVAWGKIYQLAMFKNVQYPVGKYHEDVFTTYKIVAKCKKIFVGDRMYYYYRIRPSSITTSIFTERHLDSIKGSEERALFIKNNYPDLQKLANAKIIYAVNQCVLKIIRTQDNNATNSDMVMYFQKYYRKYEAEFLCGPSCVKAKIFSIFAYINLSLLIKILKGYKIKSYMI